MAQSDPMHNIQEFLDKTRDPRAASLASCTH